MITGIPTMSASSAGSLAPSACDDEARTASSTGTVSARRRWMCAAGLQGPSQLACWVPGMRARRQTRARVGQGGAHDASALTTHT